MMRIFTDSADFVLLIYNVNHWIVTCMFFIILLDIISASQPNYDNFTLYTCNGLYINYNAY